MMQLSLAVDTALAPAPHASSLMKTLGKFLCISNLCQCVHVIIIIIIIIMILNTPLKVQYEVAMCTCGGWGRE